MSDTFQTDPPSALTHCIISISRPHILLVLINRPKKLNSLSVRANFELDSVFRWFDQEQTLRVAVISGVGRAFCVGADLKGVSTYCLLWQLFLLRFMLTRGARMESK